MDYEPGDIFYYYFDDKLKEVGLILASEPNEDQPNWFECRYFVLAIYSRDSKPLTGNSIDFRPFPPLSLHREYHRYVVIKGNPNK